ncbi:hypothetical protein FCN77_20870 [Arthrobacter sp. 24S4-2]|uniref:hypothetical protein n=1 Tax=Arthrobacter sp. 24S4-2 TaxID=2575374 RepID=UPI0010C7D9BE|nr:hypothetical protein [Arthrobacter sp. 24S4-2]QCO99710.1 hypothetical protein FCN77_20870 [Arthrobacter sp. 24S4-2]
MMFQRGSEGGGARFAALPESVSGYGGRGINGSAYSSRHGHLFKDGDGGDWWIIFQPAAESGHAADSAYGDVLACSESLGDVVHVRVLAAMVRRKDADAAFRAEAPSTYDEAAAAAAALGRRRP